MQVGYFGSLLHKSDSGCDRIQLPKRAPVLQAERRQQIVPGAIVHRAAAQDDLLRNIESSGGRDVTIEGRSCSLSERVLDGLHGHVYV